MDPQRIRSKEPSRRKSATPLSRDTLPFRRGSQRQIRAILSEPFSKLSEGLQAKVFINPSGTVVLKLFKNFEESVQQFLAWGKDPAELTREWHAHGFDSCRLAYSRIREKTGLLYLHLDGEDLPLRKTVIDGNTCDLHDRQFLLQESAELVRDRIVTLMQHRQVHKAYGVLDDVVSYIDTLWSMNITEDTFNFDHNYGYTRSGTLIQFDVGSFYEGRDYVEHQVRKRLLLSMSSYAWLVKDFPLLADHLKSSAEQLFHKFGAV